MLAVDIPSGVDGLTGAVQGPAVEATATVCLAALKPGLVFFPGAGLAGDVEVVGHRHRPPQPTPVAVWVTEEADVAAWLPRPGSESHKWSVGGVSWWGDRRG